MSRIGRLPIVVPAGVTVTLGDNNKITVKGPLGTLSRDLSTEVSIKAEGNEILVERDNESKRTKSMHGLTRVLINNMVVGVTKGFSKSLIIQGVGYKVVQDGKKVVFSVGYSHTVPVLPPVGINVKLDSATELTVSGIDKVLVGQFAADVRNIKVPDPYHIYGIRYKDEVIIKKAGKAAGK